MRDRAGDGDLMQEAAKAKRAYEVWHDRFDVDEAAEAPWHRLVKAHLHPNAHVRDKRVLEIACGRGGFACWLASQPASPALIAAADFSAVAVAKGRAYARANGIQRLAWELGDIQRLPHPNNTFHTVVCCETIEHVPDPRRALAELARVLEPGGHLFLTTPNYLGPFGLYRIYLRLRGRPYTEEGQPINRALVLPRTLRWVRLAGFRIRSVDATGHYLLLPGRQPLELPVFNRPRSMMRWFGLHSLIVAQRPVNERG